MSLEEDFSSAQVRVKKLSRTPSSDELLAIYSLYKQASVGDVQGSRPGMLDFKGRAKFDAWSGRRGMSKEKAMQGYVDMVGELEKKYG
jgi:diazepam-binding inhibitor (GABA receptor modulator, acyl-CoA-binding protein)